MLDTLEPIRIKPGQVSSFRAPRQGAAVAQHGRSAIVRKVAQGQPLADVSHPSSEDQLPGIAMMSPVHRGSPMAWTGGEGTFEYAEWDVDLRSIIQGLEWNRTAHAIVDNGVINYELTDYVFPPSAAPLFPPTSAGAAVERSPQPDVLDEILKLDDGWDGAESLAPSELVKAVTVEVFSRLAPHIPESEIEVDGSSGEVSLSWFFEDDSCVSVTVLADGRVVVLGAKLGESGRPKILPRDQLDRLARVAVDAGLHRLHA